jgi:hypothetical protein
MQRLNNRQTDQLRPVQISTNFNRYAEGSCSHRVWPHAKWPVTPLLRPHVPKWLQGQEQGWVTAEYGMLPRSTHERMRRDKTSTSGRSQEISRLIARALRSCVDLYKLKDMCKSRWTATFCKPTVAREPPPSPVALWPSLKRCNYLLIRKGAISTKPHAATPFPLSAWGSLEDQPAAGSQLPRRQQRRNGLQLCDQRCKAVLWKSKAPPKIAFLPAITTGHDVGPMRSRVVRSFMQHTKTVLLSQVGFNDGIMARHGQQR